LANALTIGETYFLREQRSIEVLEEKILPDLIRSRRGIKQSIRCWSAGCCTGEEPYSLAISLRRLLPDIQNWKIDILATDINPHFLARGEMGVFTNWSFRGTDPKFRGQYFTRIDEKHYSIAEEIKSMVRFVQFNLAAPTFYGIAQAWDIILCRNVLIYFAPDALQRALQNFYKSLSLDGWLLVGPTEASYVNDKHFKVVRFPGFCAYQRAEDESKGQQEAAQTLALSNPQFDLSQYFSTPEGTILQESHDAEAGFGIFSSSEASAAPLATLPVAGDESLETGDESLETVDYLAHQARACANEGRLDESLVFCDRVLDLQKFNASIHYLRASVLSEQGAVTEAIAGFKRALYLDSDFALAYFALGNLSRRVGDAKSAKKYFENAQEILKACDGHVILPEADGLTVRRLSEIISSIMEQEARQ
jgi:chemotaxis protein methyltransferase CheR